MKAMFFTIILYFIRYYQIDITIIIYHYGKNC